MGVALASFVLTAGAVATFATFHARNLYANFRAQSLTYALVLADAAEEWLRLGDKEALERTARLMLLGSAVYIQVVSQGHVMVEVGRPGHTIPAATFSPPLPQAEYRSVSGQAPLLEVVIPLMGESSGYLRLGLDTGAVQAAARGALFLGLGLGLALNVVLNLVLWGLRPRTARPRTGTAASQRPALIIDEEKKQVLVGGQEVRLTPKQYAVLTLLAGQPGRVFSDREILAAVWPDSPFANAKDVKQQIYLIRKRLSEARPGAEEWIVTVPGFGYRLDVPMEER